MCKGDAVSFYSKHRSFIPFCRSRTLAFEPSSVQRFSLKCAESLQIMLAGPLIQMGIFVQLHTGADKREK